jgi:hypothetical protein
MTNHVRRTKERGGSRICAALYYQVSYSCKTNNIVPLSKVDMHLNFGTVLYVSS